MTTTFTAAGLPTGTVVAGYRLDGMLGRGGMGTVYRAIQLSIGRPVAMKILHPQRLRDPQARARFLAEARRAAALDHPGLVPIHEAGEDARFGVIFYTMQLIEGRTLGTVVRQEGPLPAERALMIACQVAAALGYGHRHGLIHRDVKPENILLERGDRALLTDLGLAIDRLGGGGPITERTLAILGSPGWASPEQCRNPERASPASDVFGLGCCLHWMLTAKEPFRGESVIDTIVRTCADDPHGADLIDAPIDEALDRLLEKDPASRPLGGDAALGILREALAASQAPVTSPGTRRLVSRRRRR